MALKFVFANNAITTLTSSIGPGNTVATIAAGDLFPNPVNGQQQFAGTFIDATTGLIREVVYVTRRNGNEITMLRGREGTDAKPWSANDVFAELWTKGQIEAFLQQGDVQQQNNNYAEGTGMPTIVCTLNPPLTGHTIGMPIRVRIKNGPNSGAANLNPGPGPIPIVRRNGSALRGGELQDEDIVTFLYDGANYRIVGSFSPATDADVAAGTDQHSGVTPAQMASITGMAAAGQWGLTYSRSSGTNLAIAAGAIASDDHTTHMAGTAMTKTVGTPWNATTGLLDTGSLQANTPYFLFIIKNTTTGAVNYLSSESRTNPLMPAGYTKKKLMGWFMTDGSSVIVPFHVYETEGGGIEYAWDAPILDINALDSDWASGRSDGAPPGVSNSRRLDVIRVPLGLQVEARLNYKVLGRSAPATSVKPLVNISCPDQTDDDFDWTSNTLDGGTAAGDNSALGFAGAGLGVDLGAGPDTLIQWSGGQAVVRTDTQGRIASRANLDNSNLHCVIHYKVATLSFKMARR